MSVENLKDALPEYAKDLKLNLGSITRSTVLNEEQLWGPCSPAPRQRGTRRCWPRLALKRPTPCQPRHTRRHWGPRPSWA